MMLMKTILILVSIYYLISTTLKTLPELSHLILEPNQRDREVGTLISLILQMRTLRHIEDKYLGQI